MKQNRLSWNVRSLAMTASLRMPATVARGTAHVTTSLRPGRVQRPQSSGRPVTWTAGITASLRSF